MRNLVTSVLAALLLAACTPEPPEKRQQRVEAFKYCLDAAAKLPGIMSADADDVVYECGRQANNVARGSM